MAASVTKIARTAFFPWCTTPLFHIYGLHPTSFAKLHPYFDVADFLFRRRGGQWEKAVGILREVQAQVSGRKDSRSSGSGGSSKAAAPGTAGGHDGIRTYFGQASSLAFNAALVACAKV